LASGMHYETGKNLMSGMYYEKQCFMCISIVYIKRVQINVIVDYYYF
jgi:hypothetical protein